MPPRKHAILSASSSHRWLNCTPSARIEQEFEDTGSEAAAEGTAAHALAEHKLRKANKLRTCKPSSQYDSEEMDEYTDGYVAYVIGLLTEAKERTPDAMLLIEQRLDFSEYVPDGFGTGDALIVADDEMDIIDFKYGQGVLVEAENNPQLKLYALGALGFFNALYDIKTVRMHIYQPRRENVSVWSITTEELLRWAEEELKPKAEAAFKGGGEYHAGPWCVFCKAAVRCRARAEENLKLAQHEFQLPPQLSDEEFSIVLGKLDGLIKWANELKDYAQSEALLNGKKWPGWKLVEGRSNRRYTDEDAVIAAANAAGYRDIFRKTVIPIGEMEKLMGKKNFADILGKLVHKPAGKPTLVPETDKRPEINDPNNEFNVQEE